MSRSRAPGVVPAIVALACAMLLTSCVDANVSPSPVPSASSTPQAAPSDTATATMPPPTKFPESEIQPEPTAAAVEPVLVVAGIDLGGQSVSASGYVAGVIESGGGCDFVFTSGSSTFTKSSTSVSDGRSTSCGLVQAPISQFSSGTWTVVLDYSTLSKQNSSSQPMMVEIP